MRTGPLTLPKPFQQKYKLIEAPETDNEEEIIERVRTVVSENYENRFEKIDWGQLLIDNGMKKPEELELVQVEKSSENQQVTSQIREEFDCKESSAKSKVAEPENYQKLPVEDEVKSGEEEILSSNNSQNLGNTRSREFPDKGRVPIFHIRVCIHTIFGCVEKCVV